MADDETAATEKMVNVNLCSRCGRCFVDGQFWIACDPCKRWFHGSCADVEEFESIDIDKFHCITCQSTYGPSVMKVATNNHRQDKMEPKAEHKKVQAGTPQFISELLSRQFASAEDVIKRMRGQQLSFVYFIRKGFNFPILVNEKDGLEITVPGEWFDENVVMSRLGPDFELDVIDTRRQLSIRMNLKRFVSYMKQDAEKRTNIYNSISLELSKTSFAEEVKAPKVVSKLCWVHNSWPESGLKPAVSKYCLISMGGSYTDFHVDFGGTSVWYHILKGEKFFFLIEPSKNNLQTYENWLKNSDQSEVFFGDLVDKCYSLSIQTGQTLFIPTGWIHAVYTPRDSIVFGGNFLHSLNMSLQLEIYELEKRMKTPDKYKFPYFEMTHWYAAPNILKLILNEKVPSREFVTGVRSLVSALKEWFRKGKECTEDRETFFPVVPEEYTESQASELITQLKKEWRRADKYLNCIPVKRHKMYKNAASCSNAQLTATSGYCSFLSPQKEEDWGIDKRSDGEAEKSTIERLFAKPEKQSLNAKNECESKGFQVKLSLCGKAGSKEVTEKTLPPPVLAQKSKISDGFTAFSESQDSLKRKKVMGSAQRRLLVKCSQLKRKY